MKKPSHSKGLGRGLSALMADAQLDVPAAMPSQSAERTLPIEDIAPNPDQPRRIFDKDTLNDLAESIRAKGVIQPLIVRPRSGGGAPYEIVAGERRWRAAQIAQQHSVPVVIRDLDDIEVLEVAIIENIQRADLNPVEEARGYRQLIDRFGHTQEQVSQALGKSRSHLANVMRLLTLPEDVLAYVETGRLSAGHARALVPCTNASELARQVIAKGLSVRQTERLAKQLDGPSARSSPPNRPASAEKDSDTRALELDLAANLRMRVTITHKDVEGGGEMTIRYGSLDQLDTLCRMLSVSRPDESI